jgi:hypothetical protein
MRHPRPLAAARSARDRIVRRVLSNCQRSVKLRRRRMSTVTATDGGTAVAPTIGVACVRTPDVVVARVTFALHNYSS